MSFSKLKLGARLWLGFLSMIAIMMIVAFIGTSRMGALNGMMNGVVQVRIPQMDMLYDIMTEYDVIARTTRTLALTSEEDVKQKQKEAFDKAKTDLTNTLNKLEKTLQTEKGKQMFSEVKTNLDAVVKLSEKSVALDMAKKNQEAADILIHEVLAPQAKMLQQLQAFSDFEQELASTDGEQSAQAASGGRTLLLSIGISASVLGILLAFYITRSVTGPISRVVKGLTEGADKVASASALVASSGQQLAEGASEQAASIEETSSSLEEMSSMTKQNAENANQANNLMMGTRETVSRASETMEMLTASMSEISKASEETSKIIKTIDEIAFQTNLLALNAAVEAARAGEAGAGFAVVADEVRNLAMRAAEAAKSTASLIEGTVKKVKDGSELVEKTDREFREVSASVGKSGELVGEISAASQEQAQGIEQVNKAVGEMDKVVQRNASNAEETASASEEMSAQAGLMKDFVGELTALVGGAVVGKTFKTVKPAERGIMPRRASGLIEVEKKGNGLPHKGNGKALIAHKTAQPTRPEQLIPFDEEDISDF